MSSLFRPAPTQVFSGGDALLPSPWAQALHKPVFISFLLTFAVVWGALLLGITRFAEEWRWLERVFWLMGAASSLVGLARRLPEQNVLVSSIFVAAISTTIAVVA